MKINLEALNSHLSELNDLSNKPNHNPQEKRRYAYLLTACAALRSGASVEEVEEHYRSSTAKRAGITLPVTVGHSPEARGWKSYVEQPEKRDVEGDPIARIGTYTSLGFFVPTAWRDEAVWAMKQHDALFDEDAVTLIKSTNSAPLPIPTPSDVENVASVVAEGGSQSEVDIAVPSHVVLGGYSYKTPRYQVSLEAMQDLTDNLSVVNLFNKFSADRLARGIGHDLVVGDGSSKPLGLVTSLVANSAPVVIAAGSAPNDGSSAAGYNSLGSQDFANAIEKLDDAYANSPKVAWLMNKKTLGYLESLVDKVGHPLNIVKYVNDEDGESYPCIMGIRVRICPSMDNIGNGSAPKYPAVLGDLSFWATRIVMGELSGVKVYTEAPGLIENGLIGLRSYLQADGAVLYDDWSNPAQSPFVLIENAHS